MMEGAAPIGEADFSGLLVKISSGMGADIGGRMFLIPASMLREFEYVPRDKGAFDKALSNRLENVDYAVYLPGLVVFGSSG